MERFELLSNGMKILQQNGAFRMSTDSILLADFCTPLRGKHAADLGCGGGTLGILLCAANPDLHVTGVEIQEKACEIARRNIEINSLEARFSVIRADLRALEGVLDAGYFDAVVSNPPYFPAGSGMEPPDEAEAVARTERMCPFDALCASAARLLRHGGSFCLVHRPERLPELLSTLRSRHLEPKRLRLVRHHADAKVSLILLEARSGGSVGLDILPDLILNDPFGEPSVEYRRIYHIS